MLSQKEIQDLLPHGDGMCMIECVEHWEENAIVCTSANVQSNDNPLLEEKYLSSICLLEYAAQAAAIHAGLLQSGAKRTLSEGHAAYVGGIKNIEVAMPQLTSEMKDVTIEANIELLTDNGAIYNFTAKSLDKLIVSGRLTLIKP